MKTANNEPKRLPLFSLLALSTSAFITLLTEIMPAGLISPISLGLRISEAMTGQFITAFALGAVLTAIPAMTYTKKLRRKPLLMFAVGGFAVVNSITALSPNYHLTLLVRFFAGIFGGLIWSLLAGYAVRMTPAHLHGRAITIASAGATIALVFGVPLATLAGNIIGWQGTFLAVSGVAMVLLAIVSLIVPDFPGDRSESTATIKKVLNLPGIVSTVGLILTFVASHNILYIYLNPFLHAKGSVIAFDWILMLFGIGAIIGLVLSGIVMDKSIRKVALTQIFGFALAAVIMEGAGSGNSMVTQAAILIWGISFGGFAALVQTVLSRLSKDAVDLTQAVQTTSWNIAVAAGGILGGLLLNSAGATSFPGAVIATLIVSFIITVLGTNRALNPVREEN